MIEQCFLESGYTPDQCQHYDDGLHSTVPFLLLFEKRKGCWDQFEDNFVTILGVT